MRVFATSAMSRIHLVTFRGTTTIACSLLPIVVFGQQYVSVDHCLRDLEAARKEASEWDTKWGDCVAHVRNGTAYNCRGLDHQSYMAAMQRLAEIRDRASARAKQIAPTCARLQAAEQQSERERQAVAREEKRRLADQNAGRSSPQQLPGNYLLRQQEVQRRQDVQATQERRDAEIARQRQEQAATASTMLGIIGRMGIGAMTGRKYEREPDEDDTYNSVHDKRDKRHEKVQEHQSAAVNKIQDAASEELRFQNQATLRRSRELGNEFARFGADSTDSPWDGRAASLRAIAIQSAPLTPLSNPWSESSAGRDMAPQTSGRTSTLSPQLSNGGEQALAPASQSIAPSSSDTATANPWSHGATVNAPPKTWVAPSGYRYARTKTGQPPKLVPTSEALKLGGDVDAANGECSPHGIGLITERCESLRAFKAGLR